MHTLSVLRRISTTAAEANAFSSNEGCFASHNHMETPTTITAHNIALGYFHTNAQKPAIKPGSDSSSGPVDSRFAGDWDLDRRRDPRFRGPASPCCGFAQVVLSRREVLQDAPRGTSSVARTLREGRLGRTLACYKEEFNEGTKEDRKMDRRTDYTLRRKRYELLVYLRT